MYFKNQKGLTLLEVLLSIVILTIILVTVMKFFPQMGLMNKQNEDKQQAVNLAKRELVEWQNELAKVDFRAFLANPSIDKLAIDVNVVEVLDDNILIKTDTNDGRFKLDLIINKTPNWSTYHTEAYFLEVVLKNKSGNEISKTYGYFLID